MPGRKTTDLTGASGPFPVCLYKTTGNRREKFIYDPSKPVPAYPFITVLIITGDNGIVKIDDHEYLVGRGDIYALRDNKRPRFIEKQVPEAFLLMVRDDESGLLPLTLKQMKGYKPLFVIEPNYRSVHPFANLLKLEDERYIGCVEILESIYDEQAERKEGFMDMMIFRSLEFLTRLCRSYAALRTSAVRSMIRLALVIEYIENHPGGQHTVTGLAERAGLSLSHFEKRFKDAMGMTPLTFIMQTRLVAAGKMLRETAQPVDEIAAACNFTDKVYFQKCFRRHFGTNPARYRARFLESVSGQTRLF